MFYRFKSKLATLDRVEAFATEELNAGHFYGLNMASLEGKCAPLPLQPCAGLTILEGSRETTLFAPTNREFKCCLVVHAGKEQETIPDLWGTDNMLFCSEKFKKIVQQHDDTHEFRSVNFVDMQGQVIDKGQAYYWFNPTRFVKIETDKHTTEDLPFMPNEQESKFFYQLQKRSDLARVLSQLPIWRYCEDNDLPSDAARPRDTLYFSQDMMARLQNASLTGLAPYSVAGGQGEESVVWVMSQE